MPGLHKRSGIFFGWAVYARLFGISGTRSEADRGHLLQRRSDEKETFDSG